MPKTYEETRADVKLIESFGVLGTVMALKTGFDDCENNHSAGSRLGAIAVDAGSTIVTSALSDTAATVGASAGTGLVCLAAGVAGSLGLSLLFFFNHSSYASKHIISIICLVFTSIILIIIFLGRKKLKSKWLLPGAVCMFLGWLLALLHGYFVYKNMKIQNFTSLLLPVMAIVFGYIATKYQTSTLKDKKKFDTTNKKFIFGALMFTIMEILMIYFILIKHK